MEFESEIKQFIKLAAEKNLRMLMVGGGAVNFHGYKRHSADVDFWLDVSEKNLEKLGQIFSEMGYEFDGFPEEVKEGRQNISIKISPYQDLEIITKFNPGKTFDEAWQESEEAEIDGVEIAKYRVLNLEDLVNSKLKSARPKDLLDVQELQRRQTEE